MIKKEATFKSWEFLKFYNIILTNVKIKKFRLNSFISYRPCVSLIRFIIFLSAPFSWFQYYHQQCWSSWCAFFFLFLTILFKSLLEPTSSYLIMHCPFFFCRLDSLFKSKLESALRSFFTRTTFSSTYSTITNSGWSLSSPHSGWPLLSYIGWEQSLASEFLFSDLRCRIGERVSPCQWTLCGLSFWMHL